MRDTDKKLRQTDLNIWSLTIEDLVTEVVNPRVPVGSLGLLHHIIAGQAIDAIKVRDIEAGPDAILRHICRDITRLGGAGDLFNEADRIGCQRLVSWLEQLVIGDKPLSWIW